MKLPKNWLFLIAFFLLFLPSRAQEVYRKAENIRSEVLEELSEIGSLYFESDSGDLNTENRNQLERLSVLLEENKLLELLVTTHTDSRGSFSKNKSLSLKRGKQIKQFLVARGIAHNRIFIEALGEEQLINDCSDGVSCRDSLHRQNRRAEFIVFID
ncbi:OmpA family protein [Poritiphilus flavus]|uniref:OmpA family protein n=1 Tax=Poritiphilus flavus TaxID=2697053 RepID=A0A6L9E9R2_9FLAO|nr:OmpA family protein [Poritiphilus flavus]NAS11527.1 OmpA family protein [Poritiphilus flavus]